MAQRGDRLTLVAVELGADLFDASYLQIWLLDDELSDFERVIAFDTTQLDEAIAVLDELAANLG